jgi:flagellar biosynthesis protein FlhF
MKVKRFFAPDMRQAIQKVREDQGPDAVILSNRQVDGGIEIIAALDYDESLFATTSADAVTGSDPARHYVTQYNSRQAAACTSVAAAPSPTTEAGSKRKLDWVQDPALVAMREEISALRGLLENQLAHLAWNDLDRRKPIFTHVMRRLRNMELDSGLIEQLSAPSAHARDEQHAWSLVLDTLAATLPVDADDWLEKGGVVALVGSTGVGKTTSIAKLAARYVLRHGHRHVALVTTDSYRIGAHEQLLTYGRLLGIPVQVASDHKELRCTLNSLADKRLVLIDTAGMSQRDVRLTEQFATLADSGIPIRTLLVLSATLHSSVLEETIRAFASVPLQGAVLTKLDEAASLGGVLSALIRQQLPLMYVANGQRVPEDMHLARASKLVQQAAELADSQALPGAAVMAEQFGGSRTHVHV